MTPEEKEPYKVRAEEERHEHVRKHPDYRFRPQRRPGGSRRYNLRHSLSSMENSVMTYPSPTSSPALCGMSTSSTSSGSTSSRPSTSGGSSELDLERRGSLPDWMHPFAYSAPGDPSNRSVAMHEVN